MSENHSIILAEQEKILNGLKITEIAALITASVCFLLGIAALGITMQPIFYVPPSLLCYFLASFSEALRKQIVEVELIIDSIKK